MPTVADVLRRYVPAYLERFSAAMPREHKKVLDAITACRTGQLGTAISECASCGTTHAMGRSCGNRHCPTCQQDKAKAWFEDHSGVSIEVVRWLVTLHHGLTFQLLGAALEESATPPRIRCGVCGGPMRVVAFLPRPVAIFDTS